MPHLQNTSGGVKCFLCYGKHKPCLKIGWYYWNMLESFEVFYLGPFTENMPST